LKNLWIYPLLFGVIGALIGLILRYAYIGTIPSFSFKNVLHAHSHVMLLGFLFNALLILVWTNFTSGIDKNSYKYFIALQLCMVIMIIAFVFQGYAFYSILFSTLHLWISYILLIRLWKQLKGNKGWVQLVKVGIVFHFISSLGPYALGPLMAMGMKESPWYQQAIFFYLHFQFFGIFFTWMLALLFSKFKSRLSNKHLISLTLGLVLTFAHSLDYSFNHGLIQFFGGLGSVLILLTILSFRNVLQNKIKNFKFIYWIILFIAIAKIAGSFPQIAQLVVDSRFVLIAWLHLLFLGLYIPFIWLCMGQIIHKSIWFVYGFSVILSELILVFPNLISEWFSLSVLWLLFIAYLGVTLSICTVHLNYLFKPKN